MIGFADIVVGTLVEIDGRALRVEAVVLQRMGTRSRKWLRLRDLRSFAPSSRTLDQGESLTPAAIRRQSVRFIAFRDGAALFEIHGSRETLTARREDLGVDYDGLLEGMIVTAMTDRSGILEIEWPALVERDAEGRVTRCRRFTERPAPRGFQHRASPLVSVVEGGGGDFVSVHAAPEQSWPLLTYRRTADGIADVEFTIHLDARPVRRVSVTAEQRSYDFVEDRLFGSRTETFLPSARVLVQDISLGLEIEHAWTTKFDWKKLVPTGRKLDDDAVISLQQRGGEYFVASYQVRGEGGSRSRVLMAVETWRGTERIAAWEPERSSAELEEESDRLMLPRPIVGLNARVRHSGLGDGVVRAVRGSLQRRELEIAFDNGKSGWYAAHFVELLDAKPLNDEP